MTNVWQDILFPQVNDDSAIWEVFHENSKLGPYDSGPSPQQTLETMRALYESLPFAGYQTIELPAPWSVLPLTLEEAITSRRSVRGLTSRPLSLQQISTLLRYAYGITTCKEGGETCRPFRTVPSAGALYPLECFFHTSQTQELGPGVYHYNPGQNCIRLINSSDKSQQISQALVQPELMVASFLFFITAVFERSVFKYGNRGYRFALLEAGHVAQNLNLVAQAIGLCSLNIGGYYDRQMDALLNIDGITHSVVYIAAIGHRNTIENQF